MSIGLILSLLALILAIISVFVPDRYLLVVSVVLLAIVNLLGSVNF